MSNIKQYWEFTKWTFRGWTTGQKLWLVGCLFLGASFGEPDPFYSKVFLYIGIGIWALTYTNYVFFDIIRGEYARYKKERTDLFKTIDEGK